MRKKLKPELDLESIQSDLIETVCYNYQNGVSVRALAKQMGLSPMKTRKILITGGCYATDLSTEIEALYKDGKTISQIAELLNTTPANVNSYLPYERIIYGMEERSVEADRQARYRERKKLPPPEESKKEQEKRVIEHVRDKTMIIVAGKKLRSLLPTDVFDETSDPLARDKSYTYGGYENGEFVIHEAQDPDRMIWCAELTSSGRGKGKKSGIVLMSANCGFAVICPVPPTLEQPVHPTEIAEYRDRLEKVMLDAIRTGMLSFALPEDKVLDYTDTVRRIELVKGRRSTPGIRLEELIKNELQWKNGTDPVEKFNVRGNWTDRKFGNGDYRRVDEAVFNMLGMSEEEQRTWLDQFLAPMREGMSG